MTSTPNATRSLLPGNAAVSPDLLAFFLMFVASFITYLGLSDHPFIDFDDLRIIVNRIDTYDGLTLENLHTIIFRDHPREEPLIVRDISYLINAEIFGPLTPFGYLAGNLLLHVAASFLTYRLFLVLYPCKFWPATFTALLFALHPIHVESVAWISSRKDPLYACFFLAAFLSYHDFVATSKQTPLLVSYLLFVLSLFSKSSAIAFFPLVISYRLLLHPAKPWKMNELFYLVTIALSTLLFVHWYHWELTAFGVFTKQGVPLLKHAPGQWFLLNVEAITFYLMKLCYPVDFSIFYDEPTPTTLFNNLPLLWISVTLTAVIGFMIIKLWQRPDKRLLFLTTWFIITLAPYLNLAGVNIFVADRYCYLASIAVLAAAAIGFSTLTNRCLAIMTHRCHYLNQAFIASAIILCAVLSLSSINTIKIWESTETLWTNALRVAPSRLNPYAGLAKTLLSTYETIPNKIDALSTLHKAKKVATVAYERYCKNDSCPPAMASILIMLGKINYYEGNLTTAERHLKKALAFDEDNITALHVYGYVLTGQGRYNEAERLVMEIEHAADPKKNKRLLADIRNQLRPLLAAKHPPHRTSTTIQDQ